GVDCRGAGSEAHQHSGHHSARRCLRRRAFQLVRRNCRHEDILIETRSGHTHCPTWHGSCFVGTAAMRTPLSLHGRASMTTVLQAPLEKSILARRALRLAGGSTFDGTVAVATVDRLVGLGALRKVGARYEITHEGRVMTGQALQDHRQVLEAMSRLGLPRLVEDSRRVPADALVTRSFP